MEFDGGVIDFADEYFFTPFVLDDSCFMGNINESLTANIIEQRIRQSFLNDVAK